MVSEGLCRFHIKEECNRIENDILLKDRVIIRLCLFVDRSTYCVCPFQAKTTTFCTH